MAIMKVLVTALILLLVVSVVTVSMFDSRAIYAHGNVTPDADLCITLLSSTAFADCGRDS